MALCTKGHLWLWELWELHLELWSWPFSRQSAGPQVFSPWRQGITVISTCICLLPSSSVYQQRQEGKSSTDPCQWAHGLGSGDTFSSLLMFRVEVLQVMEGIGSPDASQVSVIWSSSSIAVLFSTYVILGFAEKKEKQPSFNCCSEQSLPVNSDVWNKQHGGKTLLNWQKFTAIRRRGQSDVWVMPRMGVSPCRTRRPFLPQLIAFLDLDSALWAWKKPMNLTPPPRTGLYLFVINEAAEWSGQMFQTQAQKLFCLAWWNRGAQHYLGKK